LTKKFLKKSFKKVTEKIVGLNSSQRNVKLNKFLKIYWTEKVPKNTEDRRGSRKKVEAKKLVGMINEERKKTIKIHKILVKNTKETS
jgi:hypothetical protein